MFARILFWIRDHYEELELRLFNSEEEAHYYVERLREELHTEVTYVAL